MIFTICNTKGGVGKTTLTTHQAILLARQYSILVIDLDDQANTTNTFVSSDAFPFPVDGRLIFEESAVITPMKGKHGIDIIPSHPNLSDIEYQDSLRVCRVAKKQIRAFVDKYDYILIDTPGSFSNRLSAALSSCDYALIPIELDNYNLEALNKLVGLFTDVTETTNSRLSVAGLIPTSVKGLNEDGLPTRLTQRNVYTKMIDQFQDMVWPSIRERESIARAQLDKTSLLAQKPVDQAAVDDFERITAKIIALPEVGAL